MKKKISTNKLKCIIDGCPAQHRRAGCGWLDAMQVTATIECHHNQWRERWLQKRSQSRVSI